MPLFLFFSRELHKCGRRAGESGERKRRGITGGKTGKEGLWANMECKEREKMQMEEDEGRHSFLNG